MHLQHLVPSILDESEDGNCSFNFKQVKQLAKIHQDEYAASLSRVEFGVSEWLDGGRCGPEIKRWQMLSPSRTEAEILHSLHSPGPALEIEQRKEGVLLLCHFVLWSRVLGMCICITGTRNLAYWSWRLSNVKV